MIMPPLISQYLAMTKNSSLAAFVGFADLMQVSGTILNQTGAALQVIALAMALYLALVAGDARRWCGFTSAACAGEGAT